MSNNSDKFKYRSAFAGNVSLNSIIFGNSLPLLEVELNEMQDVQNESRQNIARNIFPSGFTEIVDKNFNATPIVYQPADSFNNVLNSIAIAPSKAIVNGLTINLIGNFATEESTNYILLDLGEAPKTGTREDLVYLEVWLQTLTYEDNFNLEGYLQGNPMSYHILDSRVNEETTRRITVRYDIKVVQNIDFETYPNGLGWIDNNNYSKIQATVDGSLGYSDNTNLVFRPASDSIFMDCPFYKDYNLYVAGRPDYTLENSNIIGN